MTAQSRCGAGFAVQHYNPRRSVVTVSLAICKTILCKPLQKRAKTAYFVMSNPFPACTQKLPLEGEPVPLVIVAQDAKVTTAEERA